MPTATETDTRTSKNALQRLRKTAVLTQQELANAVGVHLRVVQSWEAGEAMPRPANIRKLAEVLGVTPREVLAALERREGAES